MPSHVLLGGGGGTLISWAYWLSSSNLHVSFNWDTRLGQMRKADEVSERWEIEGVSTPCQVSTLKKNVNDV